MENKFMRFWTYLQAFSFVLVLMISGCGAGSNSATANTASTLPTASLTIHLFNSTGKSIHVVVEDSQLAQDTVSNCVSFDLKVSGHTKFEWSKAESIQLKVIGPPGLEQFNQTIDVPPAGKEKGDLLIDFGARAKFYQYPMFYVPAKDAAKWKVPDEIKQKYPLKQIPGPAARYDLDFKAIGINKGLGLFKESGDPQDKGHVYMSILTEAALQQVNQGADLNYIDRDDN
jgi:hypothetical protein